jgi:SPP1 gp7 family putative phage head morphogenesis protein
MTAQWNPDVKPEAALRYFKRKGLNASFSWQDMWHEEHDAAFTIAKMMDLDLLRDMKEAVDQALAGGSTFQQFRKQVEPELVKRGWWGRAEMTDPASGEVKNVQLGSVRRLETIFRTNMQTSYSAGDWEQITDTADDAPYLMYDAIDDNRTRPQHHAWDGTTLRWDDVWWQSHRPPNGWNCRCSTIQLSADDLAAMGKSPDKVAPPIFTREFTNKRSGEVTKVPIGIDPGFSYNIGQASQRARAAQLFGEKVATVPAAMGAAAWASLTSEKPSVMRALNDSFSQWVGSVKARGTPKREWFVVGAMHPDDVAFLAARGPTPLSAEIAAEDRLFVGAKAERHVEQGNALSLDEMKAIPAAVRDPEAVLFDIENNTLLYVVSSDRKNKIVVRPDYATSKPKKQLNAVRTAFKVPVENLKNQPGYVVVRGALK